MEAPFPDASVVADDDGSQFVPEEVPRNPVGPVRAFRDGLD